MNGFAHSTANADRRDWHRLSEHLLETGRLAADFAAAFGAAAYGEVSGRLHDLGKNQRPFQEGRLEGKPLRVDHSTAGAVEAVKRWGSVGRLIAYAIAGHHAGLANGLPGANQSRRSLEERLESDRSQLLPGWEAVLALPSALPNVPLTFREPQAPGFTLAFFVRMLFSCLVDADYLDTEAFYARVEKRQLERGHAVTLPELRDLLRDYMARMDIPDSDVNRVRAEVLARARTHAPTPPGMFSLTVPTGGGKTLASLSFALEHAAHHGKRRVIYVIPYTSIVEQTAMVFRKALSPHGDAVLEHHSGFDDAVLETQRARDKRQLDMQGWDAPVVVTTAVQFFESLFGDRPSQCRKLHRIANSVIVLDEAQTLPLKLLRPCVAALDELARNYRSSVVLCTATQPALWETGDPVRSFAGGLPDRPEREIAPAPAELHRRLRRVRVHHQGETTDEQLVEHLRAHPQVLCIVNNRVHARHLYQAISDQPGAWHLTTLMYSRHRSEVLDTVRTALREERPCRLIATSLVEAGVDVDFPLVLRAEAGLDSIAQAAGRCNREGKRDWSASQVLVFRPVSQGTAPPRELREYAETASEILRQPRFRDDPLAPEALDAYFRLLYWRRDGADSRLDGKGILSMLAGLKTNLPFEKVAREFRMIESHQQRVIVPWLPGTREEPPEFSESLAALTRGGFVGASARVLQRYTVQVPVCALNGLCAAGAVQPFEEARFGRQFMLLRQPELYHEAYGLSWEAPTFIDPSNLMI
ncbi:CRISPR-associated helicase/endonuclease Cas3 [Myxococcus virescens]|uniref:CRISPR-associated endonuclease/helicase Cas3 n=1 Tax=Myxococcus virescens TaxID=83456 RepID=A0A511HQ47_9BACT|nr:CRISPR-associated helicase/endonuclease Cas3 [Myxococcus virescens]GEL75505.1 CRISPR-associated helicase/endonuclease Cas3 [Myxococcus virescens]SDD48653.1 CRISPR-associated endonuclease/helicase Cas3 [Myxococcus virescens]